MSDASATSAVNWAELFLENREALLDVSQRIVKCRRRAEDIVQDAYLKVVDMAERKGSIRQPVSYAFQVVRNLSIDRHRRLQFEQYHFLDESEVMVSECGDCLASPESLAIQRQALQALDDALSELPARTRKAFEMYRLGDYTQKDIANEMSVSPTLVNFMVKDALTACRKAIYPRD